MGKKCGLAQEDYDLLLSCLPPPGETTTVEEFTAKWQYEFGRRDAMRDTADPEMLKKMRSADLSFMSANYVKGYRDYANAWLVINRM